MLKGLTYQAMCSQATHLPSNNVLEATHLPSKVLKATNLTYIIEYNLKKVRMEGFIFCIFSRKYEIFSI